MPIREDGKDKGIAYDLDEGYLALSPDNSNRTRKTLDHLAAKELNSDNNAPIAEYLKAIQENTDVDMEVSFEYTGRKNSKGEETFLSEVKIGDKTWEAELNAALTYASAFPDAELYFEEDILNEDFGSNQYKIEKRPSTEKWFKPDLDEVELLESKYGKEDPSERYREEFGFQKYEFGGGATKAVFSGENGEVGLPMEIDMPSECLKEQLNRQCKEEVVEGNHDEVWISASEAFAYPDEDIGIEDIPVLGALSIPVAILDQSDAEVENYVEVVEDVNEDRDYNFYTRIGDDVVETNSSIFTSIYPSIDAKLRMDKGDVNKANNGVSAGEGIQDARHYHA